MSRPERRLQKRFVVFCEGDTEYNYIDRMRSAKRQDIQIALKPINMHGGGYSNWTTPHFLIVNNPDFEYVACLHVPEYKGQEVTRFLQAVLGFRSLEQFKKNREVYECLNNGERSYRILIQRIQGKDKFVKNTYSVRKKDFEIFISRTDVVWELLDCKGSNMEEFFDVIDW